MTCSSSGRICRNGQFVGIVTDSIADRAASSSGMARKTRGIAKRLVPYLTRSLNQVVAEYVRIPTCDRTLTNRLGLTDVTELRRWKHQRLSRTVGLPLNDHWFCIPCMAWPNLMKPLMVSTGIVLRVCSVFFSSTIENPE